MCVRGRERERERVKVLVEFVKSLVYPVVTLLRGGNEKREARRFTKAQRQRPQDYAMYVVDTEIDFEIAPIEFYRWPHPPGDLGWILHHYIQGTLLPLTSGFGLYYVLWDLTVKSEDNRPLPCLPIA
jgi:hypothetical protein